MPPAPYASILARNMRVARAAADLSQAEVGERMRDLGFTSWLRQTMSTVEKAKRRLTAEEVFWLSYILGTSVIRLMSPTEDDHWIAAPNGKTIHAQHAAQRMRSSGDGAVRWDGNRAVFMAEQARMGPADDGGPEDYFAPQQPVVAAIVTSPEGVLVGRRVDGKPPWTFIAGEQDAVKDENPADTAVREVKEETGLRIRAGELIGERVHPKTGRTMIYVAATPTHGTEIFVNDEAELAEVRWVGLAEADELLPGMFGPVREHLARELGEA
jgi:8-oxo-dGTP pyrophosphatase MutT (NUDIX family)